MRSLVFLVIAFAALDARAQDCPWYADVDQDLYGDRANSTSAPCGAAPIGYVADDTDCDDTALAVNPGASELCNGTDDDCDSQVDEAGAVDAVVFYADVDADTYGDPADSVVSCDAPAGYVANADDCDDTHSEAHPGGTEVCDAADVDEDCDGTADDLDPDAALKTTFYVDLDADAYGSTSSAVFCDAPNGYVANDGDCDDEEATIHPGAVEVCDDLNVDEDCDALADDDDTGATGTSTFYVDLDQDTFGDPGVITDLCDASPGFVANSDDCDDADPLVSPAGNEVCDPADVDEDCDGNVDDADSSVDFGTTTMFYTDADADTYGDPSTQEQRCDAVTGEVGQAGDCDDTDADIHPGAIDVPDNGVDEDCAGGDATLGGDAGVPHDAGPDAGADDAGPADAGQDDSDAGQDDDAGTAPADAGEAPIEDAGNAIDEDAGNEPPDEDAGEAPADEDAGTDPGDDDADGGPDGDLPGGGCGCTSTGDAAPFGLALLALAAVRRRRR